MLVTDCQIEEILHQDEHGALFLARRQSNDELVFVQRFFPFGAGGGGLNDEEKAEYLRGLESWREIEIPHVRKILAGGCDEHDGMPYLISEAMQGQALIGENVMCVLTEQQGAVLAKTALETLVTLRNTFGVQSDWLDFSPHHVELLEDGKDFRFSLNPLRWLGIHKGNGMRDLKKLLEATMGWSQSGVPAQSTSPLASMLRRVNISQNNPEQALSLLNGENSNKPVRPNVTAAPVRKAPATIVRKKSGAYALWWLGLGFFTALALAALWYFTKNPPHKNNAAIVQEEKKSPNDWIDRMATAKEPVKKAPSNPLTDQLLENKKPTAPKPAVAAAKPVAPTPKPPTPAAAPAPTVQGEYAASDADQVLAQERKVVIVKGTVTQITQSQSGKSIYLVLDNLGKSGVSGRYLTRLKVPELESAELNKMIGKNVKISGEVVSEYGSKRALLNLTKKDQITVIE